MREIVLVLAALFGSGLLSMAATSSSEACSERTSKMARRKPETVNAAIISRLCLRIEYLRGRMPGERMERAALRRRLKRTLAAYEAYHQLFEP
jgi:hypothetical protein